MTRTSVALALLLAVPITACGKHYWQSRNRDVSEFQADSGQCIQEAKNTQYNVVSEPIYRACMGTRGWERVQTEYPTNRQFRGPEDEDDFRSPPDPLSARGLQPSIEQPVKPDVTSTPVPPQGPTAADCRALGASRPEWREQCASIAQFCRTRPTGSLSPEWRARCN